MNDLHLRLPVPVPVAEDDVPRHIGSLLLEEGKIASDDLKHALRLQERVDAPLGDIMISEGLVQKKDVLSALARQARTQGADLDNAPPTADMAERLPCWLCLRYGTVPWKEDARFLYVATSRLQNFIGLRTALGSDAARLFPVIADEAQIKAHQSRLYGKELAEAAEQRVPEQQSCRTWKAAKPTRTRVAVGVLTALIIAFWVFPIAVMTVTAIWAVLTLVMVTCLKAATLILHLGSPIPKRRRTRRQADFRIPRVSIMVPLLKETEIAEALITRLTQLTYPKSLLEVVLVLEESDQMTRDTIARTTLPDWMSVIEVPETGQLTTKPRALNYALDFCGGAVIGVWDAEDWPEPDQIEQVVSRFHTAPEDVVCLQGTLDYYNSRSTWVSRWFTIEYAMWWRIVMPGIARLGLAVPLGGTTLFFKRHILEELGGWDAHNVTEDADLGVRLARHGYKTELLPTVTREEATSRPWAWVRQRSRWLKGFLVTYCVHMRQPARLVKDLGIWRFLGLQVIFLAAVSQFALAPVLWSFWLSLFGVSHPVGTALGTPALWACFTIFVSAELIGLVLAVAAVWRPTHRHLLPWVPFMMFYFVLGALAAYKALWELVCVPFYWDKTQHGVTQQTDPTPKRPKTSLL